jgi:predicted MFS family arabinose efflux permease
MEKRALFTLFFSIFAAILGLGILSPLLPTIAEDLGATGFGVGMIFSGFAISRAIIMPILLWVNYQIK